MDELEGKNRWREVPESSYYNHRMLQEKINQLNNMMQNGDVFQVSRCALARTHTHTPTRTRAWHV